MISVAMVSDAVFGAELKQLCDKEKVKVPNFVTRCVDSIEKRGKTIVTHDSR